MDTNGDLGIMSVPCGTFVENAGIRGKWIETSFFVFINQFHKISASQPMQSHGFQIKRDNLFLPHRYIIHRPPSHERVKTFTTEHENCRFEDYFFDRSSSTSFRTSATLASAYRLLRNEGVRRRQGDFGARQRRGDFLDRLFSLITCRSRQYDGDVKDLCCIGGLRLCACMSVQSCFFGNQLSS